MLWVTSDRPCVTQPVPIMSDLQQLVSFFFLSLPSSADNLSQSQLFSLPVVPEQGRTIDL